MKEQWQRIRRWFEKNGFPEHLAWPPLASDAEIAAAETQMGLRLPDDVRETYKCFNGDGDSGILGTGAGFRSQTMAAVTIIALISIPLRVGQSDKSSNAPTRLGRLT